MSELGELFASARQYGRVNIYTATDGDYSCTIKFSTSGNIELDAKSGFDNKTVEDAVRKAIKAAEEVVDSIGGGPKQIRNEVKQIGRE